MTRRQLIQGDGAVRAAGERRSPARGGVRPPAGARRRPLRALVAVAAAIAACAASRASADVTLALDPPTLTIAAGDTFTVSLVVPVAGSPFNAFDASVKFDPTRLAFVPATSLPSQVGPAISSACGNLFHRFSAAPDSLKISLTMVCGGVSLTGPGTIYKVRFRALPGDGPTTLVLGPYTEFYQAGLFVRPNHTSGMTVSVGVTGVGDGPPVKPRLEFAPPAPNPGRGGGTLMLDFSLPGPDEVRAELLDAQGRKVDALEAGTFAAGHRRVAWTLPPLASGEYFVRLSARAAGAAVRRWVVVR
jgi:hypothetical protein